MGDQAGGSRLLDIDDMDMDEWQALKHGISHDFQTVYCNHIQL